MDENRRIADGKEELIRLENDLADELLNTDEKSRNGKYTEVYERAYTALANVERDRLSDEYLRSAATACSVIKRVIGKGKAVLDIGCGFGHLSYLIAKQGNSVIGIDINRIHIQEARRTYSDVRNVAFDETKGIRLMFPDNSFHFAVSTSVFEHLHPDDVSAHLSEVHRVLKAGGKYIFTAITPHVRGDMAMYSKDPEQRQKHGFHINEKTWQQLNEILGKHHFVGKTDILPYRIVRKVPGLLFLVPLSFKAWLERKVEIGELNIRLFKLGHVFVVARRAPVVGPTRTRCVASRSDRS